MKARFKAAGALTVAPPGLREEEPKLREPGPPGEGGNRAWELVMGFGERCSGSKMLMNAATAWTGADC